jgi:hypothetical protein
VQLPDLHDNVLEALNIVGNVVKAYLHKINMVVNNIYEHVIGHGIGGIDIPAIWHNSPKSCRRKQQQKLVT